MQAIGGLMDLHITKRLYPIEFPFSPSEVVDFYIEQYAPTNRAFSSLDGEGKRGFQRPGRPVGQRESCGLRWHTGGGRVHRGHRFSELT